MVKLSETPPVWGYGPFCDDAVRSSLPHDALAVTQCFRLHFLLKLILKPTQPLPFQGRTVIGAPCQVPWQLQGR